VNLVGTLGGKKRREKLKKIKEKQEFLRKICFRENRFWFFDATRKLMTIEIT